MDNFTFISDLVKSIVWPITILIIIFIFRLQLLKLIGNIKSLKWKDALELRIGDTLSVNKVEVTPTTAELKFKTYAPEVVIKPASATEVSKEGAQARLDADTTKVGYVRGEIYQVKDGSWAIHWGDKHPL